MIRNGPKWPVKNETTQYGSKTAPETSETAQNNHTAAKRPQMAQNNLNTVQNGLKQLGKVLKWPQNDLK
jgi:hypothetical protein